MHTHTLVLVLVFTTARTATWPPFGGVCVCEPAGGSKTGSPVGSGIPALPPHLHGPFSALGYSSMGLHDQ